MGISLSSGPRMPVKVKPVGQPISLLDGNTDSCDLWAHLLASAEQVLLGSEVNGAFASIPDRKMRRQLASELMLGDCQLEDGWRRMFLRHSCTQNPEIPPGTPLVADSPGPPSFIGRNMEDALPRYWDRYLHSCSPGAAQHRNRQQAADAFPFLVRYAVHCAHSEERWPRVLSAWRVIYAIDEGHPLIPALGEFLSVGKAEIRASRTMAPIDWHLDDSWSAIRRLLRVIALLPTDQRPRTPADWSVIFRHLPLVAIVATVARAQLSLALEMIPSWHAELNTLRNRPKAESRKMLVMLAKDLKSKKWTVEKLSQLDLVWLREADSNFWRHQRCVHVNLKSKQGWLLRSIDSLEELSLEGKEMAHCIAKKHSRDLLLGHASFFSIRSADAMERLTMMMTSTFEERTFEIALSGPGNQPIATSALRAAVELIDLNWPGIQLARVSLN